MRNRLSNASAALAAVALLLCASAAPAARAHDGHAHSPAKTKGATKPVVYTCPMHPEVKSKKKGSCPKCKMELEPAGAESEDAKTAAAPAESAAATERASHTPSKMTIPDVELLDQHGRKVRFHTDLVKGKTVAINFVFTTCTTICPPLGATFARLQRELGERAGREVRLISISVDPATDTPERMKAWGAKFKAAEGWTLLTGPKPQVDELLRALGAATGSPSDHTPTVLVGNDAAGQWTRAYGLARPAVLLGLIDDAAAGRLDPAHDSTSKESAR